VAVVLTGVNDVIELVPTRRAVQQRTELADWLLAEGRAGHVVFAPLPPVHRFPLLPEPLRRVMGADARRHDAALARWAATRRDVTHIEIALELGPEHMAEDGFHPGEPVYRICGEALAAHIATLTTEGSITCTARPSSSPARGIGLAIAKRAAADGANIVIAAKTTEANPKLPGTIHSAAAEVEAAGGHALALQCDIRDEASVAAAVQQAVARFGGIDILINNASAISLTPTPATPMKRFDLMFGVNVRGTYCCTQACLDELIKSAKAGRNPHVLNMSPPLSMREHWFKSHVAYTMAKYGMSMCTLGHAASSAATASASTACGRARQSTPPRCR
jgi:NADP-dependent 3-hydroxy acid dehydrogenase YdfG